MAEFELGGQFYSTELYSGEEQFLVLKRLGPLVANYKALREAIPAAIDAFLNRGVQAAATSEAGADAPPKGGLTADSIAKAVEGIFGELSRLPDEDYKWILHLAWSHTRRRSGTAWAPVWNVRAGALQFNDIKGIDLAVIVGQSLTHNLKAFFFGSDPISGARPPN